MASLLRQLLLLASLLSAAHGARILHVVPIPAWSHWHIFRTLMWELADRGHHVTIITPLAEKEPHRNWTMVPVAANLDIMPSAGVDIFDYGKDKIDIMSRLFLYGERACERLMEEEAVQRLLKSKTEHFDLLINELFFNDCFLVLAHKFQVPIVGLCPLEGAPWMDDMVGNPTPLAYLPNIFLDYGRLDSLLDRAGNAAFSLLTKLYRRYVYLPRVDAIVRRHVPDAPSIAQLEQTTALVLLNSHVAFNVPRPMVPGVVTYGGMQLKPPKKLPQDLQKFLDDAPDGVIYFSLGSYIKGTDLRPQDKKAFIEVFSRIKQRVLWKYEDDNLPGKPDNVMISKWLPQADILAHKNVRLFMTHGGINSIQEALYHGVPLIGFPVFGDQNCNMNRVEWIGLGIKIPISNVSVESLTWAIKEVLEVPSYRETAQQRSRVLRDNPRPLKEEAAYWVEYVLRHRGAPHLRSAALDLTWYQYLLLDVIAFIVLVVVGVLVALLLVLRYLLRLFRKPVPKKTKAKSSKKRD
ncbi:UDP-glycosyltransferase UGT5-like [Schistocerca americana]|uniref:UDP-glycosyltransferase UGT5-like n=1 Tax=Schistocerca americana TaxID=7009 RepID=UPI001F502335|nr:UDP-glycosyltransferase UGT5-like [Schistocerca americana]